MSNWSDKEQLPILKTVGGVIRTIRVPFRQPPARHFYNFNNRIYPFENPIKNVPFDQIFFQGLIKITVLLKYVNNDQLKWSLKKCLFQKLHDESTTLHSHIKVLFEKKLYNMSSKWNIHHRELIYNKIHSNFCKFIKSDS